MLFIVVGLTFSRCNPLFTCPLADADGRTCTRLNEEKDPIISQCCYLRKLCCEGYVLIAVYLFIYLFICLFIYLFIYLLPSHSAEGYVLMSVYLFICLYVCLFVIRITQKVLNRIA